MNKQTSKLYKQALAFAHKNVRRKDWNTDNFHEVVAGKFAELIVKMSLAACKANHDVYVEHGLEDHSNALRVAKTITEVFEVEL